MFEKFKNFLSKTFMGNGLRSAIFFFLGAFFVTVIVLCTQPSIAQNDDDDIYTYYKVFQEALLKVRDNFIDEDMVNSRNLMYGAIKGMIESLDDDYSYFLSPEDFKKLMEDVGGEFGGLGIYIEKKDGWLTVVSPIQGTPAFEKGLKPKDTITHIEGVSTHDLILDECIRRLKGKPGTDVTITVQRESELEPFDVTITRDIIQIETVKHTMTENDTGYIKIRSFSDKTTDSMKETLKDLMNKDMKQMIIDLRYNPGGKLDTVIDVCNLFLNEGKIVSTRGRYFYENENYYADASSTIVPLDIPMIVLINEGSASAAEIFAGAMKDTNRGYVMGVPSFGKASVQNIIPLLTGVDRLGVRITVAKYFTPSGSNIHEIGIEPDLKIETPELTMEEIFYENQLYKGNYVDNFLENNPDFTEKDIDELEQELNSNCIMINRQRLERIIQNEKTRYSTKTVVDTEYDEYIKRAMEVFETGKYPEEDIIAYK